MNQTSSIPCLSNYFSPPDSGEDLPWLGCTINLWAMIGGFAESFTQQLSYAYLICFRVMTLSIILLHIIYVYFTIVYLPPWYIMAIYVAWNITSASLNCTWGHSTCRLLGLRTSGREWRVRTWSMCLFDHSTNKQRYLMPEGINARVSRYYICWHSITIVCYTFVQQLEICN